MTYTIDDFDDAAEKVQYLKEVFAANVPLNGTPNEVNSKYASIEGIHEQIAEYDGSALPDLVCEKYNMPIGTRGVIVFYMTRHFGNPSSANQYSVGINKIVLILKDQGSCSSNGCSID